MTVANSNRRAPTEATDSLFAETAARLATRHDAIVEAMLDRLWANPALARWTRPEMRPVARELARAKIGREIAALQSRELPASCPEEDRRAAHAAAAFGAPVTVVLQCYLAAHGALWEAWTEAVDELDAEPRLRRLVFDAGANFLFAYVDRCSTWVEAEHARKWQGVLGEDEQRRVRLVRAILEGNQDGAEGSADDLGYDLEGHHLGVIAWGEEAERTLAELQARLGRELLAVCADGRTWWGWLGAGGAQELDSRLARFDPPATTALAVGEGGDGVEGFRRTHMQAALARQVAMLRPAPLTRYREVALEALAMQDEQRARAFVLSELGPLTGGAREEVLIETLGTYFSVGQNASSAASLLGVHEGTVANRLRAIEQRLGQPIVSRRAELETALRLRDLFSHEPQPATSALQAELRLIAR